MPEQSQRDPREPYELARLLFAVTDGMQASFDGVASGFGLTRPQARALLRLGEPAPMRALADHLACDASNVTGIADGLERHGLIRREAAEGDRRVKLLVLTPTGERLRGQLENAILDASPVMTGLSVSERQELRSLLAKVVQTARTAVPAGPGGAANPATDERPG